MVQTTGGNPAPSFDFTAGDIAELQRLVTGSPEDASDPTGVRDLEGTGNNLTNPDYGAADQAFIRITDAYYGAPDGNGNRETNPIHDGLDPRDISNILGAQEADLATNAQDANIFFMSFGQYFDHGLDFLPKGGSWVIADEMFEDGAEGWTDPISDEPSPWTDLGEDHVFTAFLGRFERGDGLQTQKSFAVPDGVDRVTITFNFLEIDSWDGAADPTRGSTDANGDNFVVFVNGEEALKEDFYHWNHPNSDLDPASSGQTMLANGANVSWHIAPAPPGDSNLAFGSAPWHTDQPRHHGD